VPPLGASLHDLSAWYTSIVKSGPLVFATWNERVSAQYWGDKSGLAVVDVSDPTTPVTPR
jgi:hypothetical protein